jgi:PKD domain
MRTPTRQTSRSWLTWLTVAVLAIAASACGDDKPPTQPTPTPAPTPPPAVSVTAGRITQDPTTIGLVLATTFSFRAEGFAASDNSALTYTWDFGDGVRQTGGTTISHVYGRPGLFTVTATAATTGGASATAAPLSVAATTVDGRWGLQDATGTFIVRNTFLNQNATTIAGDDTALNCRFAVTGSVRAQRAITLTWTRARNDCQAFNVPEVITFTGVAEEAVNGFLGTLDTGAPARLVVCSRPSCF